MWKKLYAIIKFFVQLRNDTRGSMNERQRGKRERCEREENAIGAKRKKINVKLKTPI